MAHPRPTKKFQHLHGLLEILEDIYIAGGMMIDMQGTILSAQGLAGKIPGIKRGLHFKKVLPQLWPKAQETLRDHKRRFEPSIFVGLETNYLAWLEPIRQASECDGIFCLFFNNTKIPEIFNQLESFQDLTCELNTIIDSSADGLWVCDAQGTIIRVNPASERISDVRAADVIGRNTQELIQQGIIERSVFEKVINNKKVVSQLTQSSNGRKFIATGTPVFDAHGEVIRVVVSERDVTEIDRLQREMEEQEAIQNQFRHKIVEMQKTNLKSQKVIAKSPCMLKAISQAIRVSEVDSSVLILGESGVGKGLFADLVHKNSSRAEKPIIKINCGAIPVSLIEAELFGYEKGAFTGAQSRKPGHFELADGGILFLDEIAELPLSAQVKLLRFLEDGSIMRVGGTVGRTVDVRILAATHRNLEEMVENQQFRLDLYYRLNVIPLYVPAVRERKDCILPLLRYYLDYYTEKTGYKKRLSLTATDALLSYSFPGNVRQLINICERLVVMSETELIDLQDLPSNILKFHESQEASTVQFENIPLAQALESVEKSILKRSYEKYRNQYKMADLLGVTQATIARKLKKYGIRKDDDLD
jgi:PAS domain S-box-containing protein/TyrR family helix-turn-helix protein